MTTRAMVGTARSYVFDVVGEFWSTLEAGGGASHAYRACHEAVQLLADTVGSSSVYRSSPLERPLRDLTTLRQHVIAQLKLLDVVGGLWIDGADTGHPLITDRIV